MQQPSAPNRRALSRARRTVCGSLVGLVALIAIASCDRDKITAPTGFPLPTGGVVRSTVPNDSSLRAQESPVTATTHINIQANGSGYPYPVIGTYATRTIVRAQITGGASASPWSPSWNFTPRGYNDACGGWMPTVSNAFNECSASRYLAVNGSPALLASLPLPANCGDYGNCPTFSGGFDAQLDRLDATVDVTPLDTTVHLSGSATFRWRAVPDSLQGLATPTTFMRAFYAPDTNGWAKDTAVTCYLVGNTCRVTPQASGTLHLWIMVNGKLVHTQAHVTVPHLILTASPRAVRRGQLVRFTPTWSDNTPISTSVNWAWTADTMPGQTTACGYSGWNYICNTNVYESGTMTVFVQHWNDWLPASAHVTVFSDFRLVADKSTATAGDTVTFTPLFNGVAGPAARWRWVSADTASHDAVACADGVSPCKKRMIGSGTMWAYTSTSGGDSASAQVTVKDKFELHAAPSLVAPGAVVTFRPSLNGAPVASARWRWVPQGSAAWDSVAGCANNAMECHRATFVSGTMWAFRSSSAGGDSASAVVTVSDGCSAAFSRLTPRRASSKNPTVVAGAQTQLPSPRSRSSTMAPCSDSTSTAHDPGTDSLPTVALHVAVPTPGIDANPVAGDWNWPLGTVVPFQFSAKAGYEMPVVFVDDTLLKRGGGAAASGTVVMSREHTIRSETDTNFALRPGIAALRLRLRNMINASDKPGSYASYLLWAIDSAANPNVDDDIALAEYLEFDPVADSAGLKRFDDAVTNLGFEINEVTSGRHSITIINPDDTTRIVANRLPARGTRRRTSTQSSTVPPLAFIYVNGIRTVGKDAAVSQIALYKALGNLAQFPNSRVTYYYNRNFYGDAVGFSDSHWQCAARAVRDGIFRSTLKVLARYGLCKPNEIISFPLADDLFESANSFLNQQLDFVTAMPPSGDAIRLAKMMRDYHRAGSNTVVVAHSQGNMVFRDAFDALAMVGDSTSRCTAIMSLASPVLKANLGPDSAFYRGMTIDGDILLQLHLPNDFTPYFRTQLTVEAEATRDALFNFSPGLSAVTYKFYGLKIHSVNTSYFQGQLASTTASRITELYNACGGT